MQIYPNEVLKDLSHGSQLGITGLPVSFAEVIVLSELHLLSSLFKFFSVKCFWKLFRKYLSYIRQPMAEMILSSKAYVGVKRSWAVLTKMSKLFVCVTRLQLLQQSLYEQLICHKLNCIEQNKGIFFILLEKKTKQNKTNVQAILQERRIENNKSIYGCLFCI